MKKGKHNGAYYYCREIIANIIPNVKTDRNWILLNVPGVGYHHSIVFIHNNIHIDHYNWLKIFDDLILVCGVPQTVPKVQFLGESIYLPLSVDVKYIEQFKTEKKTKKIAYVGRLAKLKLASVKFGDNVDILADLSREELLTEMAKYEQVYAVGRVAIEAKVLGCEVKPFDSRYPDPSIWKIVDNKEAANLLQIELDKIDGRVGK